MTPTQPPITATTYPLPFHQLSPRDFERLWLVEREGYERAEHLGAAGSEQGRDFIAWRDDRLRAFQCKRVQTFGPKHALAELDKILALPLDERPTEIVFIVTRDVSANSPHSQRSLRSAFTHSLIHQLRIVWDPLNPLTWEPPHDPPTPVQIRPEPGPPALGHPKRRRRLPGTPPPRHQVHHHLRGHPCPGHT